MRVERNAYGDIVESDPIDLKCRANEEFKIIKNNAGEEVVSSIQLWLPFEADINYKNITKRRITYEGKELIPISVKNRRDTLGETVFKVVNL
ncbi:hypothetical protein [Gracilibacillus saliphilus]|uniref:hypothetical protein n=1 Tax=Gracilibacillus saliphilus TaxID=543890 RepID=UPI0013CFC037|nr:hypothetical protein [Gracilibacillus saliphilus]